MSKREFKAKMVEDFYMRWLEAMAEDEDSATGYVELAYGGDELNALACRISGNEVTLIHNTYPVGKDDYFEKEDNNFVIFESLFTEL